MKRLLLSVALLLGLATAALAVTATPIFVQAPKLGLQSFVQGTDSAGTYKTVYTGGANGSKCSALVASSTDGSATHLVSVRVTRSATSYSMAATTVPISAGTANAVPSINLMAAGAWTGLPFDSDGNPYLYLQASDTLEATYATALTAATQIIVTAVCGDF